MRRLRDNRYAVAIEEARSVLPVGLRERVEHVDFFCGVDPVYAGVHGFTDAGDGLSYSETLHCAYRHHTSDRRTTIVLPWVPDPSRIVHELGHALDETLGWTHLATPVTEYATTDRQEAFAEALVAALYWYGDQDAYMADGATRSLLASLS